MRGGMWFSSKKKFKLNTPYKISTGSLFSEHNKAKENYNSINALYKLMIGKYDSLRQIKIKQIIPGTPIKYEISALVDGITVGETPEGTRVDNPIKLSKDVFEAILAQED